jgi:hypothetical protein
LLDEHYFLNKNQKIAPKYSGPHLITKLKGDCNVELLLNNGKYTIVHVNRLKPYLSQEGGRQQFSKSGKDNESNSGSEKFKIVFEESQEQAEAQDTPQQAGETEQVGHPQETGHQDEQPDPRRAVVEPHITRRYAKEHGLVYNKDELAFQPQSSSDSEAIEALHNRRRLIRKRIKQTNEFIVVEHVYVTEQVKPLIKYEPVEEPIEDTPRTPYFDTEEPFDFPIPNAPSPEISPSRPDPRPAQRELARSVSFNPVVHRQEFHSPPSDTIPRTKEKDGFLKEVIKTTADTIFPPPPPPPPNKPLYSPDSRPIRGVTKNFFELFAATPPPKKEMPPLKEEDTEVGETESTKQQSPEDPEV